MTLSPNTFVPVQGGQLLVLTSLSHTGGSRWAYRPTYMRQCSTEHVRHPCIPLCQTAIWGHQNELLPLHPVSTREQWDDWQERCTGASLPMVHEQMPSQGWTRADSGCCGSWWIDPFAGREISEHKSWCCCWQPVSLWWRIKITSAIWAEESLCKKHRMAAAKCIPGEWFVCERLSSSWETGAHLEIKLSCRSREKGQDVWHQFAYPSHNHRLTGKSWYGLILWLWLGESNTHGVWLRVEPVWNNKDEWLDGLGLSDQLIRIWW